MAGADSTAPSQNPFDLSCAMCACPKWDGLTFLRNYRQRGGNALVIGDERPTAARMRRSPR